MNYQKWKKQCREDRYVSNRAISDCEDVGIYPAPHPLGDSHHSDEPLSLEDKQIGDAIAYFMGDLFIDSKTMSPVEMWSRVARALRIHELKISQR